MISRLKSCMGNNKMRDITVEIDCEILAEVGSHKTIAVTMKTRGTWSVACIVAMNRNEEE